MWYTVDGNDMQSIADAIRTKGRTSAPLSFPAGFLTAIENIPTVFPVLVNKTVTNNGVYSASGDNADGYSQVTVAVGPTNIASGTFTPSTSEKGGPKTISIPYLGSGYPIMMVIYPAVGPYKSGTTIYNTIQRYAVNSWFMVKSDPSTAPDYSGNTEQNWALAISIYKNSDSDPTSYSRNHYMNDSALRDQDTSASTVDCVRLRNATTLEVFVANTSYGFMAGIEYKYFILYSS